MDLREFLDGLLSGNRESAQIHNILSLVQSLEALVLMPPEMMESMREYALEPCRSHNGIVGCPREVMTDTFIKIFPAVMRLLDEIRPIMMELEPKRAKMIKKFAGELRAREAQEESQQTKAQDAEFENILNVTRDARERGH